MDGSRGDGMLPVVDQEAIDLVQVNVYQVTEIMLKLKWVLDGSLGRGKGALQIFHNQLQTQLTLD